MSDYAEHLVALDLILKELREALRNKQFAVADRLTADAMSRLARVHGWIAAQERT